MNDKFYVAAYTTDTGVPGLDKSMHLAICEDGKYVPLNYGIGVLFADAEMDVKCLETRPAGITRTLEKPWLFRMKDGKIGVLAIIPKDGEAGSVHLWKTEDLINYQYDKKLEIMPNKQLNHLGYDYDVIDAMTAYSAMLIENIDGNDPCIFEVTKEEAERLKKRLGAFDMDGSWNVNGVEAVKEYEFPFILNRADPDIIYYNEKYYFTATDDLCQKDIYIRCADIIEGLPAAEENLIFKATAEGDMSGCNWAPELHVINGELWMLFASGTNGKWDSVQCRMMRCKGNPLRMEDWETPVRVVNKNGEALGEMSITLDMTYFENKGEAYVVWAQREVAALSGKSGNGSSNLMIAKVLPQRPWQLITDPVQICYPRFGWNRLTTEVVEGPHILKHEGRIFISYSGSGVDASYCLGLLCADADADLLSPVSWIESGFPVLSSEHVKGQFGPGHNSFTKDEYGRDIIVFHAMSSKESKRHTGVRTICWSEEGMPIFFAAPEKAE